MNSQANKQAQTPPEGALRAFIAGTGCYLPERVMTNADFAKIVDTTDEWIVSRTGIHERHMARADEASSDMGAEAARRALKKAGVAPEAVDMIILATLSPDHAFPNTACLVQHRIGATKAFCFDLEAACSGFIFGLELARRCIEAGGIRTALVIGSEKMSSLVDYTDRQTCVLFGDGAGAAVLQGSRDGRGILGTVMGSDGSLGDLLIQPAGGSRLSASEETVRQKLHCIRMSGRDVFKHAVLNMTQAARKVLVDNGCALADVACVIPHQANLRIIEAIADRLDVGLDRFYINLPRTGNMSSASIPVALDEALACGRVKPGDKVLTVAFGSGFTWGSALIQL
ncbi:MAG: beta-ketoacyl-ACP synthase III [Kiritimatiellia bacterium]